ncbi:MAG: GGDEF domain-containing protein [Treponema sp.]|nr:GGDEF domain-containing protein [Treponema sp.]
MKRKILLSILIVLALLVTSIEIIPIKTLFNSQEESDKNKLVATHIYDSLKTAVEKPIVISKTIAADTFLHRILKEEDSLPAKEIEADMSAYLAAIKERFDYTAVFVVSEKSRRYYTPKGVAKIVNPKEEPYDIWYQLFIDSGKEFDLDTDRDQANNYRWAVFVNVRITDDDGSLMGVCGIGLFMDNLQNLVTHSEKEYGLKINLIDNEGLVQVDTDSANIENAYISEAITDQAGSGSFVFTDRGLSGFRLTRYMEELEWFLVVQGFESQGKPIAYIASVFLLYLILLILLAIEVFTKKTFVHKALSNDSVTEDSLTGLPNRNYLKKAYGELGVFNTLRYKSLIMFDIDRFKTVNESRDGDKIILEIVEAAKAMLGEKAQFFRWAGDEFVVFYELDVSEALSVFEKFCQQVKEEYEVTISVGIAKIDLGKSIKTNYHRAVQACYAVKENGGNGVMECK